MTQTEALKLALEALEKLTNAAEGFSVSGVYFNEELWARKCLDDAYDAMGFAQEALAQPEQEPVAWITPDGEGFRIRFSPPVNDVPLGWDALYTIPPQRTWVGLDDEDDIDWEEGGSLRDLVEAVEAKLKEKNT